MKTRGKKKSKTRRRKAELKRKHTKSRLRASRGHQKF